MNRYRTSLFLFLALTVLPAWSANSGGENAFQFLNLPGGARPLALAGAFTALSDDVNAVFHNPAGLADAPGSQGAVLYQRWVGDANVSSLCMSHGNAGLGTFGLGVRHLRTASIEAFDEDNLPLSGGAFRATGTALSLSYGRHLAKGWAVGIAANWSQESLDQEKTSAVSSDVGVLYAAPSGLRVGLSAARLGPKVKMLEETASLASVVRLGVSVPFLRGKLTGSLEGSQPFDDDPEVRAGLEYTPDARFTIRAGYGYEFGGRNMEGLAGPTAGFGLRLGPLVLDYGAAPLGDLGWTHMMSLGFRSTAAERPKEGAAVPVQQAAASAPVPSITQAIELLKARKLQEAYDLLSGLERQYPGDPRVYFYLATALELQGKKPEAVPYFQKARDLSREGSKVREFSEKHLKTLEAPGN